MSLRVRRRICIILLIILAIALVLQIVVEGPEIPGVYIILGIVGSGLLITVGKKIVGPVLQRSEDYYEQKNVKEDGGEQHD